MPRASGLLFRPTMNFCAHSRGPMSVRAVRSFRRSLLPLLLLAVFSAAQTGCYLLPDKDNRVPRGIASQLETLQSDMKEMKKTSDSIAKLEQQTAELKQQRDAERAKVDEQVRASAAATGDSIEALTRDLIALRQQYADVPWEPVGIKLNAAARFNQTVESLVGAPQAINRIDVTPFFSVNARERSVAWSKYESKEKEAADAQANAAKLDAQLKQLDQTLQDRKAELAAAQANLERTQKALQTEKTRLFWSRVWDYTKATIGIGGLIALVVFFPAVIPLIGSAVSAIVKIFPASMSYFRVASKSTLENVVTGIGKAKAEIEQAVANPQPQFAMVDTSPGQGRIPVPQPAPVAPATGGGGGAAVAPVGLEAMVADRGRAPAPAPVPMAVPMTAGPAMAIVHGPVQPVAKEILKKNLAVATDVSDKGVIDHILRKYKIE